MVGRGSFANDLGWIFPVLRARAIALIRSLRVSAGGGDGICERDSFVAVLFPENLRKVIAGVFFLT
jgi:hypothetical protein